MFDKKKKGVPKLETPILPPKKRTMKKTIYIAGKVTGLPMEEVVTKFEAAEQKLIQDGYEVVNPLKVVDNFEATWNDAMRKCIIALMGCDEIFLLPDWGDSKGAKVEYALAYNLKMKMKMDVTMFNYSEHAM